MAGFDHLKAAQRDQRKAERRADREQRKRQRRCWWTRPYRHEYKTTIDEHGYRHMECVSCGKVFS